MWHIGRKCCGSSVYWLLFVMIREAMEHDAHFACIAAPESSNELREGALVAIDLRPDIVGRSETFSLVALYIDR